MGSLINGFFESLAFSTIYLYAKNDPLT